MKSFLHDLSLIRRGIKILGKMSPFNLTVKIIKSFCDAMIPFINLYMSSAIIDALITKSSLSSVVTYIVTTLLLNFFLLITSKAMDSLNYIKFQQFYLRYNMSIGKKAMRLEYSEIENPQVHSKIKNIDDAMKIGNYGLIKLHSRIPLFMENLFKVCFSLGLTIEVIVRKVKVTDTLLQKFANTGLADLVLLLSIIIVAVSYIVSNKNIASKSYGLLGILSKKNRLSDYYMNQYLDGHKAGKDIRLYNQDVLIIDEINKFGKDSTKIVKKINNEIAKNNTFVSVLSFALNFYAYFYVCIKAMSGAFGIGSILKYTGAILQFSNAFSGMMDAFSQLRANSIYLQDYFDYIDLPESKEKRGDSFMNDEKKYDIKFNDVSFKYPNADTYTLKNVNIVFKSGEKIAIVGKNGSGKTTLIKLLCRLYTPTKGIITINGIDINSCDYDQYLDLLGVVFQDFKLFSFSLGQNVAASEIYDSEKVYKALDQVGLLERTRRMSKKIETILYKDFDAGGVEISGGEAQKIALARALYKDTPFIILDEPTAALDPIAEYEIYSNFNEVVGDNTVIFISHRLSSCRFCDRILVFDSGEIVQQGTHDELLKDGDSVYYELWNSQSQYYNSDI